MQSLSFLDLLDSLERTVSARRGLDGDRVPLVTVSDVLELADLWTSVLGQMIARHDLATPLVARWDRLVRDAGAVAFQLGADELYPQAARVLAECRRLASHFDHTLAMTAGLGDAFRAGWRTATVNADDGVLRIDHVMDFADLWSALVRYFKEARGVVPPQPGDPRGEWPSTTVGDVLWLVDLWTNLAGLHASRAMGQGELARWPTIVTHALTRIQGKSADDLYPENAVLWNELRGFARALDAQRSRPIATSWVLRVGSSVIETGDGDDQARGYRNAGDDDTPWHLFLKEWRDYLAKRGKDDHDQPPVFIGAPSLPKTTNGDAVTLAAEWNGRLALIRAKGGAALDSAAKEWNAKQAELLGRIKGAPPDQVYVDNRRLWSALSSLAAAMDDADPRVIARAMSSVFDEAENIVSDAVDSIAGGAGKAVDAIGGAASGALHGIGDVLGDVAGGIGSVAGKAAGGFFSGFAGPAIVIGGGVLGLYLLTRNH
jgi:hypothetical protein